MRSQTRLPAWTRIEAVGPGGMTCPVWIERHARRVAGVFGEVSQRVPLRIVVGRRAPLGVHLRLEAKLKRWGYVNVAIEANKTPRTKSPAEEVVYADS